MGTTTKARVAIRQQTRTHPAGGSDCSCVFYSFETVLSALFDTPVGNRPVGKFQCSRRRGTQPRNRVVVKIRYPHPDALEGKIDRTMSPWLNPSVARKLHGSASVRVFFHLILIPIRCFQLSIGTARPPPPVVGPGRAGRPNPLGRAYEIH
jgi:hypothetical protein